MSGTLSVDVIYRPIRIGLCIRDDVNDYKKALKLTHTLWGGRYNPIIPIENGKIAEKLIKLFRIDLLFPVVNEQPIIKFIEDFSYLPWPSGLEYKLFAKNRDLSNKAVFLDIYHSIQLLRSKLIQDNYYNKLNIHLIDWHADDPLANIFESMFGSYPSSEELDIEYDELISSNLETKCLVLEPDKSVPNFLLEVKTRNWLSAYGIKGTLPWWKSDWLNPGFYIGNANDFDDLVVFWNLRACGIKLIFYDPQFESSLNGLKNSYLESLQKNNKRFSIWAKQKKLEKLDLIPFGNNVRLCPIDELGLWNGLNIKSPYWYFQKEIVLGFLSETDPKTISIQLPKKPICDEQSAFFQHLVASIQVRGDIFDNEQTFRSFYVPELNEFYGRNCHFIWNESRLEPEGLGIIMDAGSSSLSLKALNTKELIAALFLQFSIQIMPSEAGRKASRIIQQLGGIQACRVFKIKGVRDLIKKYKASKSFTRSNAIQTIGQNDPKLGKPDFKKYERLFLRPRPVNKSLTPHEVFDFLSKKGIFRVGLKIRCTHCELEFWRSLEEVKSKNTCEYCGNDFEIISQLKDRDWFYRRSGIFGLDDDQAGGIPVVLTLQQLHANDMSLDKFLYVTSMNIRSDSVNINKCESDFIILSQDHDCKISLIFAECKTGDAITAQDANNLRKLADAFPKDRINTYILFSKLSNFTGEEIEICKSIKSQHRDDIIMLTDRELESWFIYEETAKEFDVNETAIKWDDLAQNTTAIFFENRRKKR